MEGQPGEKFTVEVAIDDLTPFLKMYERAATRIYSENAIGLTISRQEDSIAVSLIQSFFDILGRRPLLEAIEDRLCSQYVTPAIAQGSIPGEIT